MTSASLFQVAAVLLSGLVAGLFYGYDCSVIRGLGKLGDKEYLNAFQSINRAILNPCFFAGFIGALLVLPIAAWLTYRHSLPVSFYLMLAAALIYIIGVFGVTMAGNVPLNNQVERFDIAAASPASLMELRHAFEQSWNKLNHIRTYASIVSFLLTILAVFKK